MAKRLSDIDVRMRERGDCRIAPHVVSVAIWIT